MKELKLLKFHTFILPQWLSPVALGKKDRAARKRLFQLIEKENQVVNDERDGLLLECADKDEEGKAIEKMRMGTQVIYAMNEENNAKFIQELNVLLTEETTIELTEKDEKDLPKIVEFLSKFLVENEDETYELKFTNQDEALFLNLISRLKMEEKAEEKKEEVKA